MAIAGRRLIDGGVVNNIPTADAVELGGDDFIYVLPTRDPGCPLRQVPKTALDAAIFGIGLLVDSRLKTNIARYSRERVLIVLPAPNTAGAQPTCFPSAPASLINESLLAARALLSRHRLGAHLRLVTLVPR